MTKQTVLSLTKKSLISLLRKKENEIYPLQRFRDKYLSSVSSFNVSPTSIYPKIEVLKKETSLIKQTLSSINEDCPLFRVVSETTLSGCKVLNSTEYFLLIESEEMAAPFIGEGISLLFRKTKLYKKILEKETSGTFEIKNVDFLISLTKVE